MSESTVVNMFPAAADASRFSEAWEEYPQPRRVRKSKCKAIFDAITSPEGYKTRTLDKDSGRYIDIHLQADPDEIISGIKRYAKMNKNTGSGAFGFKEGGKFICLMEVFLNQGRWEDYL